MLNLAVDFAVAMSPFLPSADEPAIFVATNAEKASGFETLADCELALGDAGPDQGGALNSDGAGPPGSRFNRNAGNISRCEIVDGEPLIVVYPKGHEDQRPAR